MEDTATKQEIMRLMAPGMGRRLTLARWENVYAMYEQGKTLIEIGKWIGKAESTARQLLKRAALERQKRPGFTWPVDSSGRKICDIPHPMPSTEDPREWAHARAMTVSPTSKAAFCNVCRKGGLLLKPEGKTLVQVFESEKAASTFYTPYENQPEKPVRKSISRRRASRGTG